jgi:seryl-tRNA synthetase
VLNKYSKICAKANGDKRKNKEPQTEETKEQLELYKELTDDVDKLTKELAEKLTVLQLTDLAKFISELQEKVSEAEKEKIIARDATSGIIGNLVFDEVPVASDEDFNKVIKVVGTKLPVVENQNKGGSKYLHANDGFEIINHVDIMNKMEGIDTIRGSKISGERCYFLKGDLFLLNMALIQYAMNFLCVQKTFTPLYPPFFMKKSVMSEVAQLQQFDEELYKVSGDGEDKYLIATSEQPIASYHRGERLDDSELPIKYAGYSTCFRKEAGTHGKDTLGIFRVHQFDKIEQFFITSPKVNEKSGRLFSEEAFDELIANCEEFYQSVCVSFLILVGTSISCGEHCFRKIEQCSC